MVELSRLLLETIEGDSTIEWIGVQLTNTFAEGITQSAKEGVPARASVADSFASQEIERRERARREKYETSRPYDEGEKLRLLQSALKEVFVTLPAIELAALRALRGVVSKNLSVEFVAPEDERTAEGKSGRRLEMTEEVAADLARRYEEFKRSLES